MEPMIVERIEDRNGTQLNFYGQKPGRDQC